MDFEHNLPEDGHEIWYVRAAAQQLAEVSGLATFSFCRTKARRKTYRAALTWPKESGSAEMELWESSGDFDPLVEVVRQQLSSMTP